MSGQSSGPWAAPASQAASLASCKGKPLPRHPLRQGPLHEPESPEVLPRALRPLLLGPLVCLSPSHGSLWDKASCMSLSPLRFSLGLSVPFSWGLWSIFLPPTAPRVSSRLCLPCTSSLKSRSHCLSSSLIQPASSLCLPLSPAPGVCLPQGPFLPTLPPTTCLLSASRILSNSLWKPRLAPSEVSM